MSGEAIVERGDAPIARAASPLWQWAFIVISVILGVGALAAVLVSGLKSPATPATEDDGKPRLRFDGGAYEVPVFPRPTPKAPTAPEPPPTPPSVALVGGGDGSGGEVDGVGVVHDVVVLCAA